MFPEIDKLCESPRRKYVDGLPQANSFRFGHNFSKVFLTTGRDSELRATKTDQRTKNIQKFTRDQFAQETELEVGLIVSFSDAQGAELPGVVSRINGAVIEVDFNHPLAGRDVLFEVEILSVDEAQVLGAEL